MTQLLNLPNIDGNKVFVVSEGVDATYAEYLTIAWLQTIRKKNPHQSIIILLFSCPKHCLDKYIRTSNLTNINIKDYFSINVSTEKTDLLKEITLLANQHANSVLVINCLNTLAFQIGPARASRFFEKLQQNHKSQFFCIYRRDFCKNIPSIETSGSTYVRLQKSKKTASESDIHYQVAITLRKPGGSVVHSHELVCQNIESFSLRSEKITDNLILNLEQNKIPEIKQKPQASFRIEMNEQEMRQRDSVPLPYVLSSNSDSRESKIIYVPDDADDLDEEDPDDDLDV